MSNVTVTYADGNQTTAHIMMCDRVKFDLYRNRNNWPSFSEAPFLGTAFWAHAALVRSGETSNKFEDWLESVSDVAPEADTAPADDTFRE